MKKLILPAAALLLLFLNSCSVANGAYADATNGVSYTYKGISVGSYSFTSNDKKLDKNEIPYENKISFNLKDLKGFKIKGGKFFVDCTFKMKDKDGKVMLENADMFKEINEQGGLSEGENLALAVTTGDPLKVNSTYTCEFTIKDKNNPSSEISGTYQIKTVLIKGCTYTENGISSDGPWFKTKPDDKILSDNNIGEPEKIYCFFRNTSGLIDMNGMVFPDASVVLKDGSGKVLSEFLDLFKDYPDGVSQKDMNEIFDLNFTVGTLLAKGKNYTLEFNLKDKKGTGSMGTTLSFTW